MLLYIKVCAEDGHHSCLSLALCVCLLLLLLLLPQGVAASQAVLLEQQAQLALALAQHNPTASDDSMTVAYMRLMSANGLRSCEQLLETALASGAVGGSGVLLQAGAGDLLTGDSSSSSTSSLVASACAQLAAAS
jgi:hypothetical protein